LQVNKYLEFNFKPIPPFNISNIQENKSQGINQKKSIKIYKLKTKQKKNRWLEVLTRKFGDTPVNMR
jgi:hypothetical protein